MSDYFLNYAFQNKLNGMFQKNTQNSQNTNVSVENDGIQTLAYPSDDFISGTKTDSFEYSNIKQNTNVSAENDGIQTLAYPSDDFISGTEAINTEHSIIEQNTSAVGNDLIQTRAYPSDDFIAGNEDTVSSSFETNTATNYSGDISSAINNSIEIAANAEIKPANTTINPRFSTTNENSTGSVSENKTEYIDELMDNTQTAAETLKTSDDNDDTEIKKSALNDILNALRRFFEKWFNVDLS